MRKAFWVACVLASMVACEGGNPVGPADAGPVDAGPVDAGPADAVAGEQDSGGDAALGDGAAAACTEDVDCDDGDACNGAEECVEGSCSDPADVADGTPCDADGDDATRDHCVAGACVAARCGDGYVDASAGERCDDGNDVLGDGCDDCRFTCEADAHCDDGQECNGAETCSPEHHCVSGTALADGAACRGGTGRCMGGSCLARTCATDADCSDGDACNGAETCGGGAGCRPGTAMDCDDGNPCTADTCVVGSGCRNVLVDADLDGHAPAALGACGDDCDDTNRDVHPGATEVCGNGRDDDCNGAVDDVSTSTWYADCDGDGFAAGGARMVVSCVRPAPSVSGCATGGGWTARAPSGAADVDCNDANASVSPGQTMYQTTAIAGAPATSDYDYDCDGLEELRDATRGACMPSGLFDCTPTAGWQDAVPACGMGGAFIVRCERAGLGCTAVTETRTQACL